MDQVFWSVLVNYIVWLQFTSIKLLFFIDAVLINGKFVMLSLHLLATLWEPSMRSVGPEKNVQNVTEVHFRLLTANPKAEALYRITETAKKKENIIQNILRPHRYFLSFVSILVYLIWPFKHHWGSAKRIQLKITCTCKIWELKRLKSEVKGLQILPLTASLPSGLWSTKGPASEWKCLSNCQSNDCSDFENLATGNKRAGNQTELSK